MSPGSSAIPCGARGAVSARQSKICKTVLRLLQLGRRFLQQTHKSGAGKGFNLKGLGLWILQHCCKIFIPPFDFRPTQLTTGIVPAPADFIPLLAYVFAYIAHSGPAFAVQGYSRGKSPAPARKIVDRMPGPVPVPAGHRLQSPIEEAVEVDCPVLVMLRHKDVCQPPPANVVVQPVVQVPHHLRRVVSVDTLRRKGQRHEPCPVVTQAQIPHRCRCAAACAVFVGRRFRCGQLGRGLDAVALFDGKAFQVGIGRLGPLRSISRGRRAQRRFLLRCIQLRIIVALRLPVDGAAAKGIGGRNNVQTSVRVPLDAAVMEKLSHAALQR